MRINIEKAKSYIGVPYVWGGESMSEGGFDCSGFVYNVFNDSGIKVSRTTAQGYYNTFKKYEVTKTSICSGDLLFFGKSKSSISHIAIAISNTEMIESIGTKTYNALCNFQLRYMLTIDGIYGKHSYNKMREIIGGV